MYTLVHVYAVSNAISILMLTDAVKHYRKEKYVL